MPETILLYLGSVFWAITSVTGWANIVVKPIIEKVIKENIGIVRYVNAKRMVKGRLNHIDKYITTFEPNIFSKFGLINEPIEPANTNRNSAKPI